MSLNKFHINFDITMARIFCQYVCVHVCVSVIPSCSSHLSFWDPCLIVYSVDICVIRIQVTVLWMRICCICKEALTYSYCCKSLSKYEHVVWRPSGPHYQGLQMHVIVVRPLLFSACSLTQILLQLVLIHYWLATGIKKLVSAPKRAGMDWLRYNAVPLCGATSDLVCAPVQWSASVVVLSCKELQ